LIAINPNFTIKKSNTIYRNKSYKSSPSAKEELRDILHLVIDKNYNKDIDLYLALVAFLTAKVLLNC